MFERLHLHLYNNWLEFNTQNRFDDFEFCEIESIYIHNSFKNISSKISNNKFYIGANPGDFITLSDGYYDLTSLNSILKWTGIKYYKLVLSDDSQHYNLYRYPTLTEYNNEDPTNVSNLTSVVNNLSLLNQQVYNLTFFGPITIWLNFVNEFSSQSNSNELINS